MKSGKKTKKKSETKFLAMKMAILEAVQKELIKQAVEDTLPLDMTQLILDPSILDEALKPLETVEECIDMFVSRVMKDMMKRGTAQQMKEEKDSCL